MEPTFTKDDVMQIVESMDNANKGNIKNMKKIVVIVCTAFLLATLIMSASFATVIMYNCYKSYDYDYPEMSNTAISGNENKIGADE